MSPAMHHAWQLIVLWGVVVGASTGVIGSFIAAYIAARWFRSRQGLVVGVLTAANAAGQLVFLPSLATLATHFGWRAMSVVLAVVVVAFVPLVALLMRDRPGDLGLAPYGDDRGPRAQPAPPGNPLTIAFRALGEGAGKRDFWLIAGGYFVCGATTNGLIGTHLIPACVDHGLSEVAGAGLLAAAGVFSFIGGTLSGWLSDRCDNRLLLAWYYGLRGLALMYLPFAFGRSIWGLPLFAVFYGLDWIASVPPTVRLLNRVVGTEKTGIMVAWITVIHQLGSASAAYLGGVSRTAFGTYFEAFMLAGLLLLGAAVMVLFIGVGGRGRRAGRSGAGRRIAPLGRRSGFPATEQGNVMAWAGAVAAWLPGLLVLILAAVAIAACDGAGGRAANGGCAWPRSPSWAGSPSWRRSGSSAAPPHGSRA